MTLAEARRRTSCYDVAALRSLRSSEGWCPRQDLNRVFGFGYLRVSCSKTPLTNGLRSHPLNFTSEHKRALAKNLCQELSGKSVTSEPLRRSGVKTPRSELPGIQPRGRTDQKTKLLVRIKAFECRLSP